MTLCETMWTHTDAARHSPGVLPLLVVLGVARCDNRERVVQPSIVITTVPEAAVGGSGNWGGLRDA